jgi:hypothetical protein
MKIAFLYLLFCMATIKGFTQNDSSLKLYKTYNIKATDFNVDQMGNLYIVTPTGQLKKLNENGDSLAVYNLTKRYGKLYSIDATSPLKLLLYYKDFSTMIVVDRLLNMLNTIDLRKKNIFQVKAIASSYDGQYWFYDEQEGRIKKINDKGVITSQSVDLRQVFKVLPTPEKIIDNDNSLYLYDTKKGVYVFDYYGALKTTKPLLGWNNFYAFNNTIYGIKGDTLQKYQLNDVSPLNKGITIPLLKEKTPLKMVAAAGKIYFLYKTEIKVYYNQ